jgi:hypothetical protein
MAKLLELLWAYIGEPIAAALLLLLFNLLVGPQVMLVWLGHQQTNLTTLLIVGAAAAGVIFAAFFAVLTTDFGARLRRVGEAKAYIIAFAFPLSLFVVTLGLVTLGNLAWGSLYMQVCVFLLLYSTINLITMLRNIIGLGGLWQDFDRARNAGKRPGEP